MKITKSSDELINWYTEQVHYEAKRSGHFLRCAKKPPKRIEKEINNLFSSFGGCEYKKFIWEFTYDPIEMLNESTRYGYVHGAKNNFFFLPEQIQKIMNNLLVLPTGSHVYYPFYGYGYDYDCHHKFWQYKENASIQEKTEMPEKFDGAFYRPVFGKEHVTLESVTSKLKSGATLVTIAENLLLHGARTSEYIVSNYVNCGYYKIPHPTWFPQYSELSIHTSVFYGKKK